MPSGVRATANVRARGSSTSAAAGKKTERLSVALHPARQRPKRIAPRPAERAVERTRVGGHAALVVRVADGAVGLRLEHLGRAVGEIVPRHPQHDPPDDRVERAAA